ncbi:hypothetical protein TKK_0005078 [Trichogramma kaykai]
MSESAKKADESSDMISSSTTNKQSSSSSSTSNSEDDSDENLAKKSETDQPECVKPDSPTEDSDTEDDLISAINYNTITSLAALKDMLQSSGGSADGVDSFFNHYFLSHVNRLPSRNQTHSPYPWTRRLSECREEDEYEAEDGKTTDAASAPSTAQNDSTVNTDEQSVKETPVSISDLTQTTVLSANTNDDLSATSAKMTSPNVTASTPHKSTLRRRNTTGPDITFTASEFPSHSCSNIPMSKISPMQSPHFDKRFFDFNLVEMKSQASSTSTIDNDSAEDIWVRRVDSIQEKKKQEHGSQSLPTSGTEDNESIFNKGDLSNRQRAGTWGSRTPTLKNSSSTTTKKKTPQHNKKESAHSSSSLRSEVKCKTSDVKSTSHEDCTKPETTDEHKTKTVSNETFRPRSKSDISKTKKSNIIANMKTVVQNSFYKSMHAASSFESAVGKEMHNTPDQVRPRAASDSHRNPVIRVIDLIRHRSNSVITTEDKKKDKSNQNLSQMSGSSEYIVLCVL